MISLKKYLDFEPGRLLTATFESYRSTLRTMGDSAVQACPVLGNSVQQSLSAIAQGLTDCISANAVKEAGKQAEEQLQSWGARVADYFKHKTDEVRELLIMMARTAESVGERDERYAAQFIELTSRLQTIASLEDVTQMRSSLVRSATELRGCVDKMMHEGRESVSKLKAEVSTYQSKLEEAQRQAGRDALTGLDNRRSVEAQIERRIVFEQAFCIVMLDMDGFKQVNDEYGHLAGDGLLKQFAEELHSNARSNDVVGRWGGDEFILIMDCSMREAMAGIERIRKWVFGDYTIPNGDVPKKVKIGASVGVAEWKLGETMHELIGRADAAMYEQKALAAKRF